MKKQRKVPPASTVGPATSPPPRTPPAAGEARVHCRRVEAEYSVTEHRDCPYCFGAAADVATGEHKRFCDFKPGKDPIAFGFPDDQGRYGWKP